MQTFKTSRSREKILRKIRQGLSHAKLPMPFPDAEKENTEALYRHTEGSSEEAFASEFIRLGGKFVFCDNEQQFIENVHNLSDSRGWKEVLCSEKRLLQVFQNNKIDFIKPADPGNSTADACITGCEVLVGRTGTVMLSSRQNFGRTAPVFYPVHIIVAYAHQVVKDMNDGIELMKRKYGSDIPSMINFNTGPSRTADIEKTLVVGVHGPGEVFCFYINASSILR